VQPQYTYRAVSALTGLRLCELPLTQGHYTRMRNGAGPWDAVLPLTAEVMAADPVGSTVPYATEIVVERKGSSGTQVVYCGLVTDREYDSKTQQLRLAGREPWAYFDKRLVERTVNYNPLDQGLIVQNLLTLAAGSPNGDFRVDLPSTAALTTGITRSIQYLPVDCQPISAAIEQLAAMTTGFEFSLDGYWAGNVLRHQLQFGYPQMGVRGGGIVGWDIPGGVVQYQWREQGYAMGNEVFGVGDDGAGHAQLIRVKQYTGSQPLLQIVGSFRPVTYGATLLAWSQQLAQRAFVPVIQGYVRVPGDVAPEFGTYGLGDDVALQFNDLRMANVPGLYRILGWTLNTPTSQQGELVDLEIEAA
jgi:hypothetical protein